MIGQEPFGVTDGLVLCRRDEALPEASLVDGTNRVQLVCWKCHRKAAVPLDTYLGKVIQEHPTIYHLVKVPR